MEECEKKDIVPIVDDIDSINVHDWLTRTCSGVTADVKPNDGVSSSDLVDNKNIESINRNVVNVDGAGMDLKPGTPQDHFFCALCRSHISTTVRRLVFLAEYGPTWKDRVRQRLLKKYSMSVVEEMFSYGDNFIICRSHMEAEKTPAPSTFYCAVCQSDVATTVHQLLILPDPAYKRTIRQLLLVKYSGLLVDEVLSCDESSTICRSHVEVEVYPTVERTVNNTITTSTSHETAEQQVAELRREQGELRRATERKAQLEAKLLRREETEAEKREKELKVNQSARERSRLRRQKIYEDKEAHEEWKRKNRERQREIRQAQKEATENAADEEAEGKRIAYEERIRKDRERHRLRRQSEDPQVQAERRARRAECQRLRRMNQDEAARLRNNERSRQYKARSTDEQRREYNRQKKENYQLRKMSETEEEKERRRKHWREYMREYMKNDKNRELQRQRSRAYMNKEENRRRQCERVRMSYARRKLKNGEENSEQGRSAKTASHSSEEETEREEWRVEMSSREMAEEGREMSASAEETEREEIVPEEHHVAE